MIRVLVVDDSAVVRKVLTTELVRDNDIEVIAAVDPYDARDKILRYAPDVITLDIEMPRMDGLSFLARLMKYHPVPVVIVSSLTPANSEAALRALELGAVDVIAKPSSPGAIPSVAGELMRAIRGAAAVNRARLAARPHNAPAQHTGPGYAAIAPGTSSRRIIAIGASTGGPVAIEEILTAMPARAPGILIVQHMPAGFTAAFAQRLDDRCAIEVREAADGDAVTPGLALIAPGGRHLVLLRGGGGLRVGVRDGPPVHYQRPAVDVLFHSVALIAGRDAVGVQLTGMGADGASGMAAMREAGAYT
ncbi:MAG TPA: chemotaxis-specific protein-glutamate methyltransferase CheB, partial [Longimicrobiales bacterium]|nr:chemotaxis-specific protein-glutamate methyltransferase CheB [Longimicrobiales bacterium]